MCIIIENVHQFIAHCLIPLDPWVHIPMYAHMHMTCLSNVHLSIVHLSYPSVNQSEMKRIYVWEPLNTGEEGIGRQSINKCIFKKITR